VKVIHLHINNPIKDKITLVFDLDETLVHCNENLSVPSDVILSIKINNQDIINVFFVLILERLVLIYVLVQPRFLKSYTKILKFSSSQHRISVMLRK